MIATSFFPVISSPRRKQEDHIPISFPSGKEDKTHYGWRPRLTTHLPGPGAPFLGHTTETDKHTEVRNSPRAHFPAMSATRCWGKRKEFCFKAYAVWNKSSQNPGKRIALGPLHFFLSLNTRAANAINSNNILVDGGRHQWGLQCELPNVPRFSLFSFSSLMTYSPHRFRSLLTLFAFPRGPHKSKEKPRRKGWRLHE